MSSNLTKNPVRTRESRPTRVCVCVYVCRRPNSQNACSSSCVNTHPYFGVRLSADVKALILGHTLRSVEFCCAPSPLPKMTTIFFFFSPRP